jgi:DNA-binding response OmpR family regulator
MNVILVEDNQDLRDSVAGFLRMMGHDVTDSPDGERALESFINGGEHVDLVITDVKLPGMNGEELARKIRRVQENVKILFISGYTEGIIDHDGFLSKGVEFLKKPFFAKDLKKKIEEIFE